MVVEDGTGVAGADSYVTVEFADGYFLSRGIPGWGDLDGEQKEQCLVRATDYVDSMFQWRGRSMTETQSLRFPRSGLRDYEGREVTGVPVALMQSVCDVALLASGGAELFQTMDPSGRVVSERIGDLSFTYERGPDGRTLYESVNARLRGLYKDTGRAAMITGRVERV